MTPAFRPVPSLQGAEATIVVADDAPANVRLLQRLLEPDGYHVLPASDGLTALDLVREHLPDLVLTDVRMPGCDGFEVCRQIKETRETRLIPVVLMTGASERDDRLRAFDAGADDFLTKPVEPIELRARVRSLVRLKRFTDDLDSAEAVLRSLALMVEARDPLTDGHCQRLAASAVALGERLQLPAEDIAALRRGGYFHDIGKIAVPDAILSKTGPLTADEYQCIKQHTVTGARLCEDLRVLRRVAPIVRSHHELLDGSGYPDGLHGTDIPLLAQIIGIVDVYDAMTQARPYKPALTPETACAQLQDDARRGRRDATLVGEWVAIVRGGWSAP
jgi:putative two-component system response regulator